MAGSMVEYQHLVRKAVDSWSVHEVGMWLDYVNLGSYKTQFIENCISGSELVELEQEDMVMLGIKTLGHRKRLVKELQQIQKGKSSGGGGGGGGRRGRDDDEMSDSSSGSECNSVTSSDQGSSVSSNKEQTFSYGPNDRIRLKLVFKGDVSVLSIRPDIELRKLKRKARKETGLRVDMFMKDSDGDLIELKSQKNLKYMFRHIRPPIRITCKPAKSSSRRRDRHTSSSNDSGNAVPEAEKSVLSGLTDCVIIIDTTGHILYVNPATEKAWGYTATEVSGQNVKCLMPAQYAQRHDKFLSDYFRTGNSKIIGGDGRTVLAKRADGTSFAVKLTLHETKEGSRHTVTGTCAIVQQNSNSSEYSALDALLEPAAVIDIDGKMRFMNTKALEFFGYKSDEVLGHNIKMLMPSPYKENHDYYLEAYKRNGVKKVIGKTRQVLAELKNGNVIPIALSVSQSTTASGEHVFTGFFRQVEARAQASVSVLRQERNVINNLLVPGVIINEKGVVQGFNRSASKLLGYDLSEMLGRNVNMICDPKHASNHDQYLADYLRTGNAKVIGKERIVNGKRKDGKLLRVRLSVTERVDGDVKIFTAMLHDMS